MRLLYITLGFTAAFFDFAAGSPMALGKNEKAEFLFLGSYHMSNPRRDVNNIDADDVLSKRRQSEILSVTESICRFKANKVMVEVSTEDQANLSNRYAEFMRGSYILSADETEQLGFRISKALNLSDIIAIDWNDLGPIKDEKCIDYVSSAPRLGMQQELDKFIVFGRNLSALDGEVLRNGTVAKMLVHLNSDEWRESNAIAYFKLGRIGTRSEPVGQNWLVYWYGRNLSIFNNIVEHTEPGDRVLVVFGAGHGNQLIQLARDSGFYNVHELRDWIER